MINITVWVLITFSYGVSSIPTLEFKTREKCEAAAIAIKAATDAATNTLIGSSRKPICVKIEKDA